MTHVPFGHLLGQSLAYPSSYSPELLEGIARLRGRESLLGHDRWPYFGCDVWTLYEVAYRGMDGRPCVGAAQLVVPVDSPNIVESKSLKLYLFGLNNERFADRQAFANRVCLDVGHAVGAQVTWHWCEEDDAAWVPRAAPGVSIDHEPFEQATLAEATSALTAAGPKVEETLHSSVLRSLCPVTAQPDWATLVVQYRGQALSRSRLLAYVAAFYDHQGFHEQCVERIFLDLMNLGSWEALTVYARYTRRGGIDINPLRSTSRTHGTMSRTLRQ